MKIILILFILLVIEFIMENKLILHRRYENFGGDVRIMHISDIHSGRKGKDNCRVSDMARNEKPDLIFITGDFISRSETDFKSAEILLNCLCEIAPVYIVQGNHEQSLPECQQAEFLNMVGKSGAVMLVSQGDYVTIKNRKLYIFGVQQKYSTYKKNGGYRNLDRFTLNDMKSAVGDKPKGEVLMLAHNPLWAETYSQWGADYAFCGHVHGGAVRLFGIGILSPERKFFPKYSKGVYTVGNMKLCVSVGIGKLRLFNPPEIVIYTI